MSLSRTRNGRVGVYRTTLTDGTLNVAFTASVNQAKISAIELIPVG